MVLIKKLFVSIKENGWNTTYYKVLQRCRSRRLVKRHKNLYQNKEADKQRQESFAKDIKFSVIVPLYNTRKEFLCDAIESVKRQTYQNWELCLVDASDKEYYYVGEICKRYAQEDAKIRYKKLEKNEGISENTNKGIEMSTGDYLALLDHDDVLHDSALYENRKLICEKEARVIYSDEAIFKSTPKKVQLIHFKPDFAPDTVRSGNYVCHLLVFEKKLLEVTGGYRKSFDGSQDHDMILRLSTVSKVHHIPKVLYFWRSHADSVAANLSVKSYAVQAGIKAVKSHVESLGFFCNVTSIKGRSLYKTDYKINGQPQVSIIIDNCENEKQLEKCIKSIIQKTDYKNYEILIIKSRDKTYKTLDDSIKLLGNVKVQFIDAKKGSAYPVGAKAANGEHLLFLHACTEIITKGWMRELLMYSQRTDVGGVGAKLYHTDNTIFHSGMVLKCVGLYGWLERYYAKGNDGFMGRIGFVQNLTAVTGACIMVRKSVFHEVGGFDKNFSGDLADMDFCLKIRNKGYLIVYTPFAELYHAIEKKRKANKADRYQREAFEKKWERELMLGDPYYNPNFSKNNADYS